MAEGRTAFGDTSTLFETTSTAEKRTSNHTYTAVVPIDPPTLVGADNPPLRLWEGDNFGKVVYAFYLDPALGPGDIDELTNPLPPYTPRFAACMAWDHWPLFKYFIGRRYRCVVVERTSDIPETDYEIVDWYGKQILVYL